MTAKNTRKEPFGELGTTVGTFFGPSVPVAWSAATLGSLPLSPGIGGKNAKADAWSCMVNDV